MDKIDSRSLERGASNDIVRLRWRIKIRENVVSRLQAENERLRLTDAEREAIEQAIDAGNGMAQTESWAAATLRDLLERLK